MSQAIKEAVDPADFVCVVDVAQDRDMKVAVADVTDDRRHQSELREVALGLDHAIG